MTCWPSFSTSIPVTCLPAGSVSTRKALVRTQRVMFGLARAGRTQLTSASLLASTWQGKPSQVLQRMQRPPSRRSTPMGRWKGCSPLARRRPVSSSMAGSWGMAGNGIGAGTRRLGRVLARLAVDLVDFLDAAVVGFQFVVGDGPGRRGAAFMLQGAEILAGAGGAARRHRPWCCRPQSSGRLAGRVCHQRRTRFRRACNASVSKTARGFQFSGSWGR